MNSALTPSHGSVFTQSQYSVTDPLANSLLSPTVNTTSFVYNLAPGQSVTSPALLGSIGATGTFTDAPTLSQFTTNGAGSIYLPVTTNTITFTANTGGNTASGQVTTANATGTVTYNYISNGNVPEPGALALISAGAVSGFFIIRRRRRK
jgi:hypothetical protein